MYFDYLNILVFAAVGFVFVFANLLVASIVRPKRVNPQGLETYECGEETIGSAWIQFDIRYYTVALVYVIFAVEIAFLFPWALVYNDALDGVGAAAGRNIGLFALAEGLLFVAILFLGLVYVWKKGDLDWVLSYQRTPYQPRGEVRRRNLPNVADIEAERAAQSHAKKPAEEAPGSAA